MLNYMKSEFYRSRHNGALLCLTLLCLFGACTIVFVLAHYKGQPDFPYAQTVFSLSNIFAQLPLFLFLTVGFSYVYYGTEDKDHTLKHTISYGTSRRSVFFGKFITQAVICIGVYYVICLIFAGLSYAMLDHSNRGEFEMFFRATSAAIPVFLWVVTLCQIIQFLVSQTGVGIAIIVGITSIIPAIINMLARKVDFLQKITVWLPYNLIAMDGPILKPGAEIWKTVIGGTVWLVVFLIAGDLIFKKLEVK